jgi:carboxymethylenebutenolidase
MSELITLESVADGFGFGTLHAPAQGPRRGGVIVIQEIFGLDRYVQEDVARWSAAGFEALAPSMFDRAAPGFVAEHDPAGMAAGIEHLNATPMPTALADVQTCVNRLKASGPVFLVGYCYGGAIGWLAAGKVEGLSAVSSYYGGRIAQNLDSAPKTPIICHFGRKDAHIPADETKAAINAAYPDVPVYIYENSGHGFNNDGRPDSDAADAALARARTIALFEANGAARG